MTNYERGAAFERQVKADLEANGYVAVRAAGSHSPVDVYAFRSGEVVFVQCKLNGRLDPGEWNELYAFCAKAGATPVLADKPKRGVIRYRKLTGEKGNSPKTPVEEWRAK